MSPIEFLLAPTAGARRRSLAIGPALAAAWAAASLAGCAAPPVPPPPPPPPVVVAPVIPCDPPLEAQDLAARHLLAVADRLSALNTADLTQEANRGIDPGSVEATMDQAVALSMTRTPGDLVRAQGLLEQVLHNTAAQAEPWRALARLLAWRFNEQRRAEELADRTLQQVRDTQRDYQRRIDQLNDKLEALKAIERSLNTRPGSASAPAPALRQGTR